MEKLVLSLDEAAEVLGVKKPTLYAWARSGVFPDGVRIRIGRKWFFNRQRLMDWLDSGGSIPSKE